MAFETGVASSHLDLWEKLNTFLTANPELVAAGQAWDVPWTQTQTNGDIDRVYRNRGTGVGREILVGMRMRSTGLVDTNKIFLCGMTAISQTATRFDQHINPSRTVGSCFLDGPMNYWFVSNGRRFAVVYKISTTYHHLYGGLLLPFATPLEYPYPLAVGGTFGEVDNAANVIDTWRSTDAYHTAYFDGSTNTATGNNRYAQMQFLNRNGTWEGVDTNTSTQAAMLPKRANNTTGAMWRVFSINEYTSESVGYQDMLDVTTELLGGGFAMRPLRVVGSDGRVVGDLDGIFYTDGAGNASENTLTKDGVVHTVFQNVFRTSFLSYMSMRLS